MKKLLHKSLLALFLIATSTVSKGQTYYFQENFSADTLLPAGWSNDSLGQPGLNLWIFNNAFVRPAQ